MIDRAGYWSRVRFIEPMECLAVDKLPVVDTRLAGRTTSHPASAQSPESCQDRANYAGHLVRAKQSQKAGSKAILTPLRTVIMDGGEA